MGRDSFLTPMVNKVSAKRASFENGFPPLLVKALPLVAPGTPFDRTCSCAGKRKEPLSNGTLPWSLSTDRSNNVGYMGWCSSYLHLSEVRSGVFRSERQTVCASSQELSAMDPGDEDGLPETPRKNSGSEEMVKRRLHFLAPLASASEVTINSF